MAEPHPLDSKTVADSLVLVLLCEFGYFISPFWDFGLLGFQVRASVVCLWQLAGVCCVYRYDTSFVSVAFRFVQT